MRQRPCALLLAVAGLAASIVPAASAPDLDGLTARQAKNLERWGYPFVFEEFRFHMTLTGPIVRDRRDAIRTLLQSRFDAIDGARQPLAVAQIALLRQEDRSTPFRVILQADLTALRPQR